MVDLAVIAMWAAVSGVVYLLLDAFEAVPTSPLDRDAVAFLSLVLPAVVTFAFQEASERQATLGKRRLGLITVTTGGARIGLGRSLARSGLKFLPWQIAHTAVFHLISGSTGSLFLGFAIAAQLLVVADGTVMVLHPQLRAAHDLFAGTRVIDASPARAS